MNSPKLDLYIQYSGLEIGISQLLFRVLVVFFVGFALMERRWGLDSVWGGAEKKTQTSQRVRRFRRGSRTAGVFYGDWRTAMATTMVPLEVYLTTSYSPDVE
jgi:hypothetical protein